MKNLWIHGIVLPLIMLYCMRVSGQIEVHDGGKISIGGRTPSRPPCQAYINGGSAVAGMYIEHNNFNSWSSALITNVSNPLNTSYDMSLNGAPVFYVSGQGWMYCGGVYITSDSSLKTNIIKLTGPLDKLNKINGYNYHYKTVTFTKGLDSGKTLVPDTVMHAGVLANEIEQVAPYAVKEMRTGKKAVDYIQLIPLLIEGVKDLNRQKNDLSDQLAILQARFNKLAESIDTSGGNYKLVSNKTNTALDFVLYQNSPNPFNEETSISYSLKGTYSSASIYIFDLQGTLKKSYALNSSSSLTVKSSELTPGMYFYSLVVDGKEIDTKRMILTK
jgi:hypothetical protein